MLDLSNEQLIQFHIFKEEIEKQFQKDKQFGFNKELDTFFLLCKNLNPQKYGLRAQAYFALMMNYELIPSSWDCGDFETQEGERVEFKCSFLSSISRDINVRQVRSWQELQHYYVFSVDFSDYYNIVYKTYKLSKEQMKEECDLLAKPCHMTAENNAMNERVELGFVIRENSDAFKRWEQKYLLKNFNLKKLCDKRIAEINKSEQLQEYVKHLEQQLEKYETEKEYMVGILKDVKLS